MLALPVCPSRSSVFLCSSMNPESSIGSMERQDICSYAHEDESSVVSAWHAHLPLHFWPTSIIFPFPATKHIAPNQLESCVFQEWEHECIVVKFFSRIYPRSSHVCLNWNLTNFIKQGRIFGKNIPGRGHLAAFAINLDNTRIVPSQKLRSVGRLVSVH